MSDYQDTFERIATRGTPIGATALVERARRDLSEPVVYVGPARPRLAGWAVAAIVFAVVLSAGAVWGVLTLRGTEIADGPIDQWIALGVEETELFVDFAAGPGGVLRWSHLPTVPRSGVEFSPDALTWSKVELPDLADFTALQRVAVSADRWLITASDGDNLYAWVSADGMDWTPVEWPASLRETIIEVIGSANGFLAVSIDVFGVGTTLWWSPNGEQWSQLPDSGPGDIRFANVRGTSGGIVWIPFANEGETTQLIYHSIDATTWIEGRIELPPELTATSTRSSFSLAEYVGGQWIVIGQVFRTDAEPVLLVWVSVDGVNWTLQGSPEFSLDTGAAVYVFTHTVIDNHLIIAPTLTPLSTGEDGIVSATGVATSTGELWASQDGASWERVLRTDAEIDAVTGIVTGEGETVGLWVPRAPSNGGSPVVTTLTPQVDPLDLDQVGLDLQADILADGAVTRAELQQALEGWKACMEDKGLIHVSYEINPRGGWSSEYGSPDRNAGEAEDAACRASYLNQVANALP